MKIERISDNQLKLTLTKDDLLSRDIKLEDLMNPSEKTQQLFRDIMEQTMDEQDFLGENTPLMVEAVPMGIDGIMIIITKVDTNKDKKSQTINTLTQAKEMRRWKKSPLDLQSDNADKNEQLLIYSVDTLDDAIHASIRLANAHIKDSSLFKHENRFFLVLQADTYHTENDFDTLETLLEEYGQKHVSTPLAKYYLFEHGEIIIKDDAVKSLAKSFAE